MCVLFISNCRKTCDRGVFYSSPYWTWKTMCSKNFPSADSTCILSIAGKFSFFLRRVFVFTYGRTDRGAKLSGRTFSNLACIQLIRSMNNLISGITVLHTALVMMHVSVRSSKVSVSVSICSFTSRLQTESSVNMFHLSGSFCTKGFSVYETLYCYFTKCSALLVSTNYRVRYVM